MDLLRLLKHYCLSLIGLSANNLSHTLWTTETGNVFGRESNHVWIILQIVVCCFDVFFVKILNQFDHIHNTVPLYCLVL